MNRRKNSFGLSASELRVLHASHAASQAGMPFTAMLAVHFGQIDEPIGDAGAYLRRKVIDRLGTWFRRRRLPWVGAWVREKAGRLRAFKVGTWFWSKTRGSGFAVSRP
jgi:hypothetical protein